MNFQPSAKACICSAIALVVCSARCAPVEFDDPAYHIIVCRPLDSWSGDQSVMDSELDMVKSRRAHIRMLLTESGTRQVAAGEYMFGSGPDDPTIKAAAAAVTERGFEVTWHGAYHWALAVPTHLEPGDFEKLRTTQASFYTYLIRSQGDPARIPGSMMARHFLGTALAVAATGVGGDKLGATGAYVAANSFSDLLTQLPFPARRTLAPFNLPMLDGSQYAGIDVYPVRVNEGGSNGQVIVAYKKAKTPEDEHAALVKALVSLAGADTTVEAVETARAADLAYRKQVWDDCVKAGQCKP